MAEGALIHWGKYRRRTKGKRCTANQRSSRRRGQTSTQDTHQRAPAAAKCDITARSPSHWRVRTALTARALRPAPRASAHSAATRNTTRVRRQRNRAHNVQVRPLADARRAARAVLLFDKVEVYNRPRDLVSTASTGSAWMHNTTPRARKVPSQRYVTVYPRVHKSVAAPSARGQSPLLLTTC